MVQEVPALGNVLGKCVPARFVMAILASMGMAINYGLRVNLSVTMVAMLNHTAVGQTSLGPVIVDPNATLEYEVCSPPGNVDPEILEDGPFVWSEPLQGTLLSCYFWGYLVSLVPGGLAAENYSAKWVMFLSTTLNATCCLLIPVLTEIHYMGLLAMRVLQGIAGGVTFPTMHCLIAAWSPPNERSIMSTIIYCGTSLGTAISIMMAGMLADQYGWESVFYVSGGLSMIWVIVWVILVQDNPNKQRFISQEERNMINASLGKNEKGGSASEAAKVKRPPVPWKRVFSSLPFWAIVVSHFCSNWGWYMILIDMPFYMKQVLALNVSSNAIANAIPYIPMTVFCVILGKFLDVLRTRKIMSTTVARKFSTGICSIVPSTCLLTLCFIGCRHLAAVIVVGIAITSMAAMFSGFLTNHIDIAPNFAGVLVGLTNLAGTSAGILVPIFVGYVTKGNQNILAWRIIFFVTTGLFMLEFVVFTIFGTGEEQSWNKPAAQNERD